MEPHILDFGDHLMTAEHPASCRGGCPFATAFTTPTTATLYVMVSGESRG